MYVLSSSSFGKSVTKVSITYAGKYGSWYVKMFLFFDNIEVPSIIIVLI